MLSSYRGNANAPAGATSNKPILVQFSGVTPVASVFQAPTTLTHANSTYTIPDSTSGVTAPERTFLCDTSGGVLTINFPATPVNGEIIEIKRTTTDGNALTLQGNGKNLEGAAGNIADTSTALSGYLFQYDSVSGSWWEISTAKIAPVFGNQSANTIYAGPTSGGAAAPTFRAAVAADIPGTLGATTFTGTVTPQGLVDISGASAGQIKFPATQNPSADANTLDDYEEGTWTPIDSSGASLSITNFASVYVKVGQLLCVDSDLQYPSTANGANAVLGGFPFTSQGVFSSLSIGYNSNGSTAMTIGVSASDTKASFFSTPGAAQQTNANLSTLRLRIGGSYRVSA